MAFDVYQAVTDRILEALDAGTVPWRRPLKRTAAGDGFPKSLASGKRYRGVNVFLLALTAWTKGYDSDYWATFNQVKEKNAHVRKGEKSSFVVFWKELTVTDQASGEEKKIPMLRYYNVFNAKQCEGLAAPDVLPTDEAAEPFEQLAECEKIVTGYPRPPTIEHVGHRACYIPAQDKIEIASPDRFENRERYYAVLFHEIAHSTGHPSRLDREDAMSPTFGDASYSKEELVAELGAAFLAAAGGISPPTIDQSAAYIDGWRKKLQGDKKLVVQAAGAAQRAADHVLGVDFEFGDKADVPPPEVAVG
jgi:antirestriction protein ArdC